jgi:hypothetical protein
VGLLFYPAKGECEMDRLDAIISMLDHSLGTSKKRHIVGGVLMSISLLFGGLAVTVVSFKEKEIKDE